ncbi:T9SS type A sorting domain-containing protein [Chitinophagaceae bacterium MMS25-I14]
MKYSFLILTLLLLPLAMKAQTCRILINYDDNGYRISRLKDCNGPKPAGPGNNGHNTSVATIADGSNNQQDNNNPGHLANGAFRVYPNPTENVIYINPDATLLQSKCTVTITDITGKVIMSRPVTESVTAIDLTLYASGTYSVILNSSSGMGTVKVIRR